MRKTMFTTERTESTEESSVIASQFSVLSVCSVVQGFLGSCL